MYRKTILLVDDEKEMRKKLKKFVSKKGGYKVIEAPKAIAVADVLMRSKSNLDLILLDINLPEVDGRDIAEIIQEYAPEIPIIITSVLPIREQKIRVSWAVDYYKKSDKKELLLKKIRRVIGVVEKK